MLMNTYIPIYSLLCNIIVGYDISYYNYSWIRDPHLKTSIHLDNHDVQIVPFTFDNSADLYTHVSSEDDGGKSYPGLGVRIRLTRHLGKL